MEKHDYQSDDRRGNLGLIIIIVSIVLGVASTVIGYILLVF